MCRGGARLADGCALPLPRPPGPGGGPAPGGAAAWVLRVFRRYARQMAGRADHGDGGPPGHRSAAGPQRRRWTPSPAGSGRRRPGTRGHPRAIFTLHCRLLEALNVTDFRLGKAYGLGRALAETALVPAAAAAGEAAAHSANCWRAGRVITLNDWLVELKTLLPDHAAYAVTSGLGDWQDWVASSRARPRNGGRAGKRCGRRASVAGTDHRREGGDRHAEPVRLPGRGPADRLALPVGDLLAALIAVGVVVTMVLLPSIPPTARLIAALAWIGGTLAAATQGVGRAVRLGGQGRRRLAVADRAGRVRGAGRDPAATARPAPAASPAPRSAPWRSARATAARAPGEPPTTPAATLSTPP